MDSLSYLNSGDVTAIENLYRQYLNDKSSVDSSWQQFFHGFEFARANYQDSGEIPEKVQKEFAVINLINGYRTRGHLFTRTNPVRERRKYSPTLDISNFGLRESDLDDIFQAGTQIGIGAATLRTIIDHLEATYCRSIGAEFMFIREPQKLKWLQERMEKSRNTPNYSVEEKKAILRKLTQAVVFENFMHTKFVGQKRFSLEGCETLIPAMESLIRHGAKCGISDFVIGMAHRGRLNVLANIMGKSFRDIFVEFEGAPTEDALYDGDVKYHMGYSADRFFDSGKKVHLSLTANPSHLEAVNPVVEGITRSKIDNVHNGNMQAACPVLIHGDAAVAGQGIVYEVIQMMSLDAYKTGGTVHIVINNQVGFTTNYLDARSSTYCTDVAKVVLAPVFHVNADDVEAVAFAVQLALDYRHEFGHDVFIDLLGYRKYGHNEGDEPRFTQPILYKEIAKHNNPRKIYADALIAQDEAFAEFAAETETSFKEQLQRELDLARSEGKAKITSHLEGPWKGLRRAVKTDFDNETVTKVSSEQFLAVAEKITTLPADRKFINKITAIFKDRGEMIAKDRYDWAMGELMAYATLLDEGFPVRFSGQDVERGTFSHRHAVVKVEDSEEEYVPLNNIRLGQPRFDIYNSHLSEYAVLGFELGYAMGTPRGLTIWEAQFGDFFNGAQIIIDQFITSAEYKWRRMNGLVMLLPHGYEGQGPEHSSARMERFLQQCAEENIQIVNTTTPAQQFHVLRRQLFRDFRKPLICFTPKKLLRYPSCVSSLKDFTEGTFREVIDDASADPKKITRLVFCTGKFYYDLTEHREKTNSEDTAIIRIEQLYPFPEKQIAAVLKKYSEAEHFIWAQEEPENMGAWTFVARKMKNVPMVYIGRDEAASPATGFAKMHNAETYAILDAVFMPMKKKSKLKDVKV
ncbi:MAG: 2-oxoglutarate dehydrogenase E1 component [Bacteroidia bacterium]|nr:2-oxoglutarate dehydrogenase E1 component [Bacteroidia bacterium]